MLAYKGSSRELFVMNTITLTPALSGSPSVLFAALWVLEALAATRRSCITLWHHLVCAVTPEWLMRHYALVSTLKAAGVTHTYRLREVQRYKAHVVNTRSDPLWKQAMRYHHFLKPLFVTMTVAAALVGITAGGFAGFYLFKGDWVQMLGYIGVGLAVHATILGITKLSRHLDHRVRLKHGNYRFFVYWREVSLDEHVHSDAPTVPDQVIQIADSVHKTGGYTSIDEAKRGDVYVDPFLYVSAVPMWISGLPGLRWLRRCVTQWGDDEFETGGFADRATRPL